MAKVLAPPLGSPVLARVPVDASLRLMANSNGSYVVAFEIGDGNATELSMMATDVRSMTTHVSKTESFL